MGMLRKGVIPIPPETMTAGRAALSCKRRSPNGPSNLTSLPSGSVFNARLKAVLRIRVATISLFSKGALAIEKPRVLPSASVSPGASSVIIHELARHQTSRAGFSNSKAQGPKSATSQQLRGFAMNTGHVGL